MKILFIQWANFGKEDITEAFTNLGHEVIPFIFPNFMQYEVSKNLTELDATINSAKPDLVFSSNFSPNVSALCYIHSIPYAAWVYDSPQLNTYSATLVNPTNYVFMFDSDDYNIFSSSGVSTVYYLPLAANARRMDKLIPTTAMRQKLQADVSFVGRFYDEDINHFAGADKMNDYSKGYMNAIMDAQRMVSGVSFIEPLIKGELLKELQRTVPHSELKNNAVTDEYLYSRYFIEKKITTVERKSILATVSEHFDTKLYTVNPTPYLPKVNNMGTVNPYTELPYVFKCSKINLNISLRSIHAGIPLRAIEIMGSNSFLMSNFQKDFLMFFEPDKDFVYYEDEKDLVDKCRFYLEHEDERLQITKNGYEKVKEFFSYEALLQNILDTIFT